MKSILEWINSQDLQTKQLPWLPKVFSGRIWKFTIKRHCGLQVARSLVYVGYGSLAQQKDAAKRLEDSMIPQG